MTTRSRLLPSIAQKAYAGKTDYHESPPGYPGGRIITSTGIVRENAPYLGGRQTTVSEGHQISQLRKSGLNDIGGPFETTKQYVDARGSRFNISDDRTFPFGGALQGHVRYDGIMFPRIPLTNPDSNGRVFPQFPPSARSSNDALDEFGATAISRCKPTNPPVDAAQAIGELYREGLPHLIGSASWKARTGRAKAAASDYLNVQFGWRPLVDEIFDFKNTLSKFDTVLSQYERDSGKVVRRNYEFPIETTSSDWTENNNPVLPAMGTPGQFFEYHGSPGNVLVTEKTVTRRWFSGAFTYYLPSDYDSRNGISKVKLIADRLGLKPSPDLVWELTPWSWAVDWFSNAGDVVSNVSDFGTGGLVMHYGYIMEHSIRSRTYFQPNPGFRVNLKLVAAGPLSLVTETKVRRQANPFGFGVSWEGLSTFQASILAALGITRRG